MPEEAWVVVGGVILAVVAGIVWSLRRCGKWAADHMRASYDLHGRSEAILDRQEELQRRSRALIDRQEEMLRRAELLVERLERLRNLG